MQEGRIAMLTAAKAFGLLAYHYGLGMNEAKSISETAAYFHLTEKYARAIETHTLGRLREMMNDGKIV